jgi:hypothetical protein
MTRSGQTASRHSADDISAPKRDNSVSNFRFICIFLMTFAHNYFASGLRDFGSQLPYAAQHSPLSFASLTLFDGFARISIPFLGCLAGYFVSMNLREQTYVTVVKRRFVSLYLPVIFWSIFYFGLMIAVGYATSDYNYISRKLATVHLDDFLGLTKWPINYPLHYLVSLFKCVLIAPILIFILRRFGLPIYLLTVVISFLLLVGTDLRHGVAGTHENSFWPRAEILFFFSIGIFANRRWNIPVSAALERVRIKSTALLLVTLLIFVGGTLHWRWLVQQRGDFMLWSGFLALTAVRISGTLLVLSLLPWLRKLASVGIYCNDRLTFNLFCTHVISFHILPKALAFSGWNASGTALFFVAPLFATALAGLVFWSERRLTQALTPLRAPTLERSPVLGE